MEQSVEKPPKASSEMAKGTMRGFYVCFIKDLLQVELRNSHRRLEGFWLEVMGFGFRFVVADLCPHLQGFFQPETPDRKLIINLCRSNSEA